MLVLLLAPGQPGRLAGQDESHLLTFSRHKGPVYALAISPDGMQAATSAEDNLVYIWDISTGEILKTIEGYQNPVKYLEFSPDGRYLITAAATAIRMHDMEAGTRKDFQKHVTHVYNVCFSPDASGFLSTSLKTKFLLWDLEKAEVIHEFEGHSKSALVAAWSPDGQWIASGSGDQTIRIWDAASRETLHTISAHGGNIYSLDFSPDSRFLASASMDENVKLWDVKSGRIHMLLEGHEYAVVFVRFSPDGRYLISASYDRTIRLWELATGNCIYTFVDQEDAIYTADFTPDGEKIISCSNDGTAVVYIMSPRFIAEYYYFNELEKEMEASGLAGDRRKGESREEYRLRTEKAAAHYDELCRKYHRKHLGDLGDR